METITFDSSIGKKGQDNYDVVECSTDLPTSIPEAIEYHSEEGVLQGYRAWLKQNASQGSKKGWLDAAEEFGVGSEECEAAKAEYALTPAAYKPGTRKTSDGVSQKAAQAGVRNLKSVTSELPDDQTYTKAEIAEMLGLNI